MMKNKAILPFLALVLCMGVIFFPMTAYAQISDTTPPTLAAELSGDTLTVQAKDDDSGVEAIYIGSHRFSTLVNGAASIKLGDYAGNGKQVAVYAVDAAGNRSQTVMIGNPYYVEPATAPTPTASAAVAASAPSPTAELVMPEPVMPDGGENGDAAEISESAITDGQNAFTPEGEGTVLDNASEEDGKEFFTVTATDGSVYYLIIDRQRGTENVYFLSAVTRDDLVSLADDGASTETGIVAPTPQPPESESDPLESEQEQPEEAGQNGDKTGTVIFILLIVAAIGGVGYYVKIVKPRRQARQEDEAEYEDDLEDEDGGEYLFEGETDEYYPGGEDTAKAVDNDGAARYNDTTDEETN